MLMYELFPFNISGPQLAPQLNLEGETMESEDPCTRV